MVIILHLYMFFPLSDTDTSCLLQDDDFSRIHTNSTPDYTLPHIGETSADVNNSTLVLEQNQLSSSSFNNDKTYDVTSSSGIQLPVGFICVYLRHVFLRHSIF